MGSSFSAEVNETRELANFFFDTFSREYENLYRWFLVQHVRSVLRCDDAATNNGNTSPTTKRLFHAPFVPKQLNERCDVMAAKRSKHLKRWKPRFFVLRGDYMIDYYDSRGDFASRKRPLGTINVGDVVVNYNATQAVMERVEGMAAAFCIPAANATPPDKFPEMTVELYNRQRDPIYIQFPKKERYVEWCAILEKAHWLSDRLHTKDDLNRRAFIMAYRRARIINGLQDFMEFSGTETKILKDTIMEIVDNTVVPKLLSSLSGSSWKNYTSQLGFFYTKAEGLLEAFVLEKWHMLQETTCSRRTAFEVKVREELEKLDAVENDFREEVKSHISENAVSFFTARIKEPLEKLATEVAPLFSLLCKSIPDIYESCVSQGKVRYNTVTDRMFLATNYNSCGVCYDLEDELWNLREPISLVKADFDGRVYEAIVIYETTLCPLRRIITDALFTFETLFERDKMQRTWDDVMREVRGFVRADSEKMLVEIFTDFLFETAVCFFREECVQPFFKEIFCNGD